ncbi:sugar ABC transporter ATP-binding protein [Acrocarpospora pleiomorpha]|uniref:Sugar ABC transporter ATP-binding protein n=1 Tax=Acrocarpospora pleiomorpha TaxID=90975 RepID=A0A5M3XF24_9ACTN|nr:sugar ABC transporter ATP-binding protein [Acrocarpospora pleiomorpha]GES19660.1 sugar ABC transporter ATP-binding protein [Acrocarpospora pleiomorpha]
MSEASADWALEPPALRFSGLTKRFGQSEVLQGVSFDVAPGEIHALLGANGAGKSTLIKILAGVYSLDSGSIEVHGVPLESAHGHGHDPEAARAAGIAFVHQDLGLVEDISVADNIALQLGYEKRFGLVSSRATSARVARVLATIGAEFAPDRMVSSLSRDEQVLCAVARALALEPRIVILDEVSASLPKPEVERLSRSLRSMRRGGAAFLYVTHRLDELTGLVDRVTVLRNGKKVVTAAMSDLSHDALVRHIVGAEVRASRRRARPQDDSAHGRVPKLVVRDLTTDVMTGPISFDVHAGEVLGICGLVGSGTRELAQTFAGAYKPTGGTAELNGRGLPLGRPEALASRGCAVVPGDRQREGIITGLALRENLLPTRRAFGAWSRAGFRSPGRETQAVLRTCEAFGVVPRDRADRDVSELSGGNQQKIVFARALADRPEIAVLEDPTAGVDIGSREVLYDLIHEAADAGTAVLLISTDFEEVAAQSHRVLVLSHGLIAAEFPDAREVSADRLAEASYAVAPTTRLPGTGRSLEDQARS